MGILHLEINGHLTPFCMYEKLLGVSIYNLLMRETHVKELCKKVSLKVYTFRRLQPILE